MSCYRLVLPRTPVKGIPIHKTWKLRHISGQSTAICIVLYTAARPRQGPAVSRIQSICFATLNYILIREWGRSAENDTLSLSISLFSHMHLVCKYYIHSGGAIQVKAPRRQLWLWYLVAMGSVFRIHIWWWWWWTKSHSVSVCLTLSFQVVVQVGLSAANFNRLVATQTPFPIKHVSNEISLSTLSRNPSNAPMNEDGTYTWQVLLLTPPPCNCRN